MRFFVRKSNNWVQARVGTIPRDVAQEDLGCQYPVWRHLHDGCFRRGQKGDESAPVYIESTEDFCRHVVRVKSFEQSHDIFVAIASLPMENRGYLHQAKFQGYLKAVQTAWLDVIAKGHLLKVSKEHLRIL